MKILIQKFGGTSLASIERIRNAAEIAKAASQQGYSVVAVASAMGHTTDNLLTQVSGFNFSNSRRELDMLLATGEQVAASLLAIALNSSDGPRAEAFSGAQAGIITDSFYGSAEIKHVRPNRILETLSKGRIAVVSGYQGIDSNNDVTTLGRGGSDTSAVALAAAIRAERCDIYTDVNAIYSADPKMVESAYRLDYIPVDKMLKLADFGAQVMASSSMQLAASNHVSLRVRSAFDSADAGTLIGSNADERQFYGLAIDQKEDLFALAPLETIEDAQQRCDLLRTLQDHGINTDIMHRIRKNNDRAKFLFSASSRNVVDAQKLVADAAAELGLSVLYRDAMAKISVVGTFSDPRSALLRFLSTLFHQKIYPPYWSCDERDRVSVMLRRDQIAQAAQLIHHCFVQNGQKLPVSINANVSTVA